MMQKPMSQWTATRPPSGTTKNFRTCPRVRVPRRKMSAAASNRQNFGLRLRRRCWSLARPFLYWRQSARAKNLLPAGFSATLALVVLRSTRTSDLHRPPNYRTSSHPISQFRPPPSSAPSRRLHFHGKPTEWKCDDKGEDQKRPNAELKAQMENEGADQPKECGGNTDCRLRGDDRGKPGRFNMKSSTPYTPQPSKEPLERASGALVAAFVRWLAGDLPGVPSNPFGASRRRLEGWQGFDSRLA